ncbi:hypothetical protein U8335_16380 [Roseiconus lacunae]|uniref:tetratricopeptide repeat protein n=1 Tax=Roseiconus lacunae TaxID=2605694 RepID=UPI0030912BCA|nr:hypothetical protein U8335_16380 [Stieleria sp. HD01]
MSVWDWYQQHVECLDQNPDATASDWIMFELFAEATEAEDPEVKLIYYREAKDAAQACGDKAFALWCDAWIGMETCSVGRYSESLHGLTKAAVEARHSRYNGLPQQIMVNVLTIDRMGDIDPFGYLAEIEKGVEYLESICQEEPEHGCVYWSNMAAVYTEVGRYDQATRALDYLLRSVRRHSGYEYYSSACMRMAVLQSFYGQWDAVFDLAEEGLRNPPKPSAHTTLLMAMARALLRRDEPELANKMFAKARVPLAKCHASALNYDFATAFYVETGNLENAISEREKQYAATKGQGRHWEYAKSCIELSRLHSLSGNHSAADRWAEQAQLASENLRDPKVVFDQLKEIKRSVP